MALPLLIICGATLIYDEEHTPPISLIWLGLLFGLYLQLSGHGRWVCLLSGVGSGGQGHLRCCGHVLLMTCAI